MTPCAPSANPLLRGGVFALLAAIAFGLTTPLIQRFGHGVGPIPSATLLYAGAALVSIDLLWKGHDHEAPVRGVHLRRLVLVALAGAVVAPVCLTWGLQRTRATSASLLLNFEAIFTVILAWLFYREPIGRRVVLALVVMGIGGASLVLGGSVGPSGFGWGTVAVVLATASWAIDNTLTRPLADLNPTQVVRWKGALGAAIGLVLSLALHQPFPRLTAMLALLVCGATGYGLSLRFYLLAQRRIGAGRTGSIFALAPFVGVAAAWALGERSGNLATLLAAALFGLGVYLHLTETHGTCTWRWSTSTSTVTMTVTMTIDMSRPCWASIATFTVTTVEPTHMRTLPIFTTATGTSTHEVVPSSARFTLPSSPHGARAPARRPRLVRTLGARPGCRAWLLRR